MPVSFDTRLIVGRLTEVLSVLRRIPRRMEGIACAEDFLDSDLGEDRLDSICMTLIAVGEAFKHIDRKTAGQLLPRYEGIDWKGVMGVRDVIAHGTLMLMKSKSSLFVKTISLI